MIKISFKGQISLLVIISVIIVIGTIFIISMNSNSISIFSDEKSSYKVKTYIENCLEQETKQAVKEIGLHGGWLYHNEMIFSDRDMPDMFNKKAKGINQFGVTIPYWYYYDDSNEIFKTNIPPYDTPDEYSLKNQVKKYLEDGLETNCIQSFKPFKEIYDINYEPKEIKGRIEIIFDKDEIITQLNLPLEIVEITTENKEYISTFEIKTENKLWVPYFLAKDIVAAEMNHSFIEKRTLGMINAYQSTKNRELLPPFYDFSLKFDFEPWKVEDVKKLTKQIIESNIGLIQFINTNYQEYSVPKSLEENDFVQGFSQIYAKDYLSESSLIYKEDRKLFRKYRDYKVTPIFQSTFFPLNLELNPSLGNILLFPTPEMFINFIPFFFTQYTTVYEMTYPVMFEIKSEQINDHTTFNLVIESNIAHNTPLSENYQFDSKELDELNDKLDSQKSLICDPAQMISDYVYLNITDPVQSGERKFNDPIKGVEGAIVTFDCKGLSNCFITQTENNGEYISNNISKLKFRLPINCNPGVLEIYKFGHKKIIIEDLDPSLKGKINLGTLQLPSEKEIDLKVKILDPGLNRFSKGRGPSKYEKGFVIFTNVEDEDVIQVVEFSKDNIDNLTVKLTIGNYNIEGFLLTEEAFEIPSEEICYDKGVFQGEECETLPQLNFSSWMTGGIKLEKFNIELDELLSKNAQLTISIINYGMPRTYEELEESTSTMQNLTAIAYEPSWYD